MDPDLLKLWSISCVVDVSKCSKKINRKMKVKKENVRSIFELGKVLA